MFLRFLWRSCWHANGLGRAPTTTLPRVRGFGSLSPLEGASSSSPRSGTKASIERFAFFSWASGGTQDGLRGPLDGPKTALKTAKRAPRRPKTAPRRPKRAQSTSVAALPSTFHDTSVSKRQVAAVTCRKRLRLNDEDNTCFYAASRVATLLSKPLLRRSTRGPRWSKRPAVRARDLHTTTACGTDSPESR